MLRDERVNVGHWNLPERSVEDCRLFRFSGYQPDTPGRATRYADRLDMSALNGAGEMFTRYREALLGAGWEEARAWPFAFDRFADGTPIPPVARLLHDELGGERFGDPFAVGAGSFAAWLREPVDERWPSVSRLSLELHRMRDDVRASYPDPLGADRVDFAHWTRNTGAHEHRIPAALEVSATRPGSRAVVAIAGRNRLPSARVLAESLREHHPDIALHVVLADDPGEPQPAGDEPFVPHWLSELNAPGLTELALRSTPLELSVRLKPISLAALLAEGYSAALFLDTDQWVLGDLGPLWDAIERNAIVLTPHLAAPAGGSDAAARERMLLRAGTHNAGAIGVSDHPEAHRMLAWWASGSTRSTTGASTTASTTTSAGSTSCPRCLQTSQSCATSASTSVTGTCPSARDADVRLLHASGFDPAAAAARDAARPAARRRRAGRRRALLERYAQALLAAGQREANELPWGWSIFADGTPVPHVAGELLAALGSDGTAFRRDPWPPVPAASASGSRARSTTHGRRSRGCGPACTRSAPISGRRSRTRSAPTAPRSRAGSTRTASSSTTSTSGRPVKHESRLARGGFRIAGAGFEPATFGL